MFFAATKLKDIKCALSAAGVMAACLLTAAEAVPASAAPPAAAPAPVVLPPDYDSSAVARYISLVDDGNGAALAELYEEYTAKNGDDDFARLILAGAELRNGSPRTAVGMLQLLAESAPLPGDSGQHHTLYARTLWELANACLLVNDFSRARGAFELLAALPVEEVWQSAARGGSVYAAIQGGEFSRAGTLLESAEEVRGRDELKTWLLFRTGAFDDFTRSYALLEKAGDVPADLTDIRREMAMAAGEHFEKSGGAEAAFPYWNDAFVLEMDTARRMVLGRKLVDAHVAMGDIGAAVDAITRYLELFPEDTERGGMILLKARLAASVNVEKALHIYRAAGEDEDLDYDSRQTAFTERALLLEKEGRYSESLASSYALAEIAADPDARQDAALLTAGIHERAGNDQDALVYYRKAASHKASSFCEAGTGAARTAAVLQEWQTVLEYASLVIEAPETAEKEVFLPEASYRMGEALTGLGRAEEALAIFLQTSVEHSDSTFGVEAAGRAGDINTALSRYGEALKNYDFAAGVALLNFAGESREFIGSMRLKAINAAGSDMDMDAVKEQLEALYKNDPASDMLLTAVVWYGDLLKNLGRNNDAILEFAIWEERFAGDDKKTARLCLEEALASANDTAGRAFALERLEKALASDIEAELRQEILFETADVLNRSGDYQRARTTCIEAISLISDRPGIAEQQLLALLVMRLGDNAFQIFQLVDDREMLEESINAYASIIDSEFLPDSFRPQAAYRLGKCYEESTTPGKALKIYEEVLAAALLEYNTTGTITGRAWVMLSGNAGISLALKQKSSAIGARALKLVENMEKLDLPTESDSKSLAAKIRSEFAL